MALKTLKTIPVYIEEDHHEVLPHIFKNIGRLYLYLTSTVNLNEFLDMYLCFIIQVLNICL